MKSKLNHSVLVVTVVNNGELLLNRMFNLMINLFLLVTQLNAKPNQPLMLVIQNTTWTTLYQISV